MEKWYSKYRRGDVWFLQLDSENGDGLPNSSVERKSRPYLIVSCEENNLNSPTINVVPITTRNNDRLPMHVFFIYQDGSPNGRNQIVLCEQITTVSEQVFQRSKSKYLYSFNLDFMNKVDETLTRQLGLKPRVADMKVIERLVDELASKKEAELKKAKEKELKARVESIVQHLARRFGIDLTTEVLQNELEYRPEELRFADKATVKEMHATAEIRKSRQEVETVANPEVRCSPAVNSGAPAETTVEAEVKSTKRRKGTKWTTAQKQEFVDDYSKMSISAVASKWSMTKKTVQQTAWIFRKELGGRDTR